MFQPCKVLKGLKPKETSTEILNLVKISFKTEGKRKTFSDHWKQKEFITHRSPPQEMLKEVIQPEGMWSQIEIWIHRKEWRVLKIVNIWVSFYIVIFLSLSKKIEWNKVIMYCEDCKICRINYMTTVEQRTLGTNGIILFVRFIH